MPTVHGGVSHESYRRAQSACAYPRRDPPRLWSVEAKRRGGEEKRKEKGEKGEEEEKKRGRVRIEKRERGGIEL